MTRPTSSAREVYQATVAPGLTAGSPRDSDIEHRAVIGGGDERARLVASAHGLGCEPIVPGDPLATTRK
jgi:hypothetical protein